MVFEAQAVLIFIHQKYVMLRLILFRVCLYFFSLYSFCISKKRELLRGAKSEEIRILIFFVIKLRKDFSCIDEKEKVIPSLF